MRAAAYTIQTQRQCTRSTDSDQFTRKGGPHARWEPTRERGPDARAQRAGGPMQRSTAMARCVALGPVRPARRGRTRANAFGRRARPAGGAASDARLPKLCVSCTGNRAPDDDQEGHNGRLCRGWEIQEVVDHSSDSRDGVGRDEHDGGGHAGGGIDGGSGDNERGGGDGHHKLSLRCGAKAYRTLTARGSPH